jgi:glycosyltransferase involved in cell wall biosynthesis
MPAKSFPRLAVVLSHPTQYYSPWFRWLRTRFRWLRTHTPVDFRVFYLWDFGVTRQTDPKFGTAIQWDVDLLSGYDSEFVPNVSAQPGTEHFGGLNNPELTRRLAAWHPGAVLFFGYKWASHLRAILWARRKGIPMIFRGDSHLLGRGQLGLGTRLALRALYAQFAAFLPVGVANRAYFEALGVPSRKLVFAPHAVNDALFDATQPEHRAAAADLRRSLGLVPSTRTILFAGKLVPEKQPRELLAAFLALNRPGTALIFVGEGPDKPSLIAEARNAAAGTVHFLPFANQSEMPSRYLLGDVFALPSRGFYETWGLAVNEAMHMGVPALVSDRVGCQQDLVTDGETGWVFRADDPTHLREKLGTALQANSNDMKTAVAKRICGYTYAQTSHGLLAALGMVGGATGN